MITYLSLFLSILGILRPVEIVWALITSHQTAGIHRIELPFFSVIFVFAAIGLITWGMVKIFQHEDHDH